MKKKPLSITALAMSALLLSSCLKDGDSTPIVQKVIVTNGAIVINNGSPANGIDGSLSAIDLTNETVQKDAYKDANGTGLKAPSEGLVYGSKVYILESSDNQLCVANAKTFKKVTNISTVDLMGKEEGVGPRTITAYGGNVYFSTSGGYVAEVDTINFGLKKMYKVGTAPGGMAVGLSNNVATLYVTNKSEGENGGTISAVNLGTGSVSQIKNSQIANPQQIAVAANILYILDGGTIDANGTRKNAGLYEFYEDNCRKVIADAAGMTAAGYNIVTYNLASGSDEVTYSIYNISTGVTTSLRLSGDSARPILAPTAISVDPNTGFLMIGSRQGNDGAGTQPGFVNIYNGQGQFRKTYDVGVEPRAISFTYATVTVK